MPPSRLITSPCRSLCWWADTGTEHDGLPMFACAGCGSQWVRGEPWSPRQADGSWPNGVREQLLLGRPVSTGPGADAAGSAGS